MGEDICMPQPVHITFIHGLANKPALHELRRIWLDALALTIQDNQGFDLGASGVTSSFVYWANLFYDTPLPASEYESRKDELKAKVAEDLPLDSDAWTQEMFLRFNVENEAAHVEEPPTDETTPQYERIPIPWFLKQRLMQHFVKEAHDYLFNVNGIRDKIQSLVMEDFSKVPQGTRHVLVGHSQGSFIAYDILTRVTECKAVDGLLTLGSPLGVDEIQDKLVWSRENGFPGKLNGDWVNVYDPYDAVARLDPQLRNDFKKNDQEAVIDVKEENWGKWRHSATKYFKGPQLRHHLRRLCKREDA
jgi:hypothetical protein